MMLYLINKYVCPLY